jgi:hypothetical protein
MYIFTNQAIAGHSLVYQVRGTSQNTANDHATPFLNTEAQSDLNL